MLARSGERPLPCITPTSHSLKLISSKTFTLSIASISSSISGSSILPRNMSISMSWSIESKKSSISVLKTHLYPPRMYWEASWTAFRAPLLGR